MINRNQTEDELFKELKSLHQPEKELLEALIIGQHSLCTHLVDSYLEEHVTIQELYEDIIKKALYSVGEMWEFNKISVATEHLASAIVESILNRLYHQIISEEKDNRTVIAACVENEFHQIGIKMVSDVFELNGWNALFLGANTPTSELISFISLKQPDLLALSLSLYFNIPLLEQIIQRLQKEFPHLLILVGGQAFQHGGVELLSKYKNVVFQPDLTRTELFIKSLN